MNPSLFIDSVIKINKYTNDKMVPWLMGPTGVGKSYSVRKYAEEHGYKYNPVILTRYSEFEFAGIPKVRGDNTVWTTPDWLTKEKCIFFFDEVDKAHWSIVTNILTFITERRLRDYEIHPESIIIIASQPIEPVEFEGLDKQAATLAALRARSVLYAMEPIDILGDLFALSETDKTMYKDLVESFTLPVNTKLNIRQTLWLRRAYSLLDKEVFKVLALGIIQDPKLIIKLFERGEDTMLPLIKNKLIEDPYHPMWNVGNTDLVAILSQLLSKGELNLAEYELLQRILIYFRLTMPEDEIQNILKEDYSVVVNHSYSSEEEFKKYIAIRGAEFFTYALKTIPETIFHGEVKNMDEYIQSLDKSLEEFKGYVSKLED